MECYTVRFRYHITIVPRPVPRVQRYPTPPPNLKQKNVFTEKIMAQYPHYQYKKTYF